MKAELLTTLNKNGNTADGKFSVRSFFIRKYIMKNKKILKTALGTVTAFLIGISAVPSAAAAAQGIIGIKGDINCDNILNVADLVAMEQYLIGGHEISERGSQLGSFDDDGEINSLDLAIMRKYLTSQLPVEYQYGDDIQHEFISPPIYDMYGSLPSHGDARMAVFHVDFPDCSFETDVTDEQIKNVLFGEERKKYNTNYPNESISAFYKRASKGVMALDGEVYSYTARYNKSFYENDVYKTKIIDDVISGMDSKVDFSSFDGDGDRVVDAVLILVPNSAGNDNWWPAAGVYTGLYKIVDNVKIGHVIVGNEELYDDISYSGFTSTYTHESTHCMGIPDYYLYSTDDFEGLRGEGGFELMDEVRADLSAVSKLMLGWFREDQVMVFGDYEYQTFTLKNGQTDDGNCVIIPYGKLDDKYRSEFLVIEYTTLDENNSAVPNEYWWEKSGEGIRIFHVDAEVDPNDYWKMFMYDNANLNRNENNINRRFIRITENYKDSDNLYTTGRVIDYKTEGFAFYDSYGLETVDPGVIITVGELTDDGYTITIKKKG